MAIQLNKAQSWFEYNNWNSLVKLYGTRATLYSWTGTAWDGGGKLNVILFTDKIKYQSDPMVGLGTGIIYVEFAVSIEELRRAGNYPQAMNDIENPLCWETTPASSINVQTYKSTYNIKIDDSSLLYSSYFITFYDYVVTPNSNIMIVRGELSATNKKY